MLTKKESIERAIAAGVTLDQINHEASLQARQVGTTPFANMIRALNMATWRNTADDWKRLAGAMVARNNIRKKV